MAAVGPDKAVAEQKRGNIMKQNQHHIRYGVSVHTPSPVTIPGTLPPKKIWHSLLTWQTRLDEDTLDALTEALRPRRLRAE